MNENFKSILKNDEIFSIESKEQSKIKQDEQTNTIESKNNINDIENEKFELNLNDVIHSKNNTKLLNEAYSALLSSIFGKRIKYFWIVVILIIFVFAELDIKLLKNNEINYLLLAQNICQSLIKAFGFIFFVIMLGFPSIKGIRNVFVNLIEKRIKKDTK